MRSDPSSVISTASTMATPAKLEAGDRVLGTYGDEFTRRARGREARRRERREDRRRVLADTAKREAGPVSSMRALRAGRQLRVAAGEAARSRHTSCRRSWATRWDAPLILKMRSVMPRSYWDIYR